LTGAAIRDDYEFGRAGLREKSAERKKKKEKKEKKKKNKKL
jgi:hypothetical protein